MFTVTPFIRSYFLLFYTHILPRTDKTPFWTKSPARRGSYSGVSLYWKSNMQKTYGHFYSFVRNFLSLAPIRYIVSNFFCSEKMWIFTFLCVSQLDNISSFWPQATIPLIFADIQNLYELVVLKSIQISWKFGLSFWGFRARKYSKEA